MKDITHYFQPNSKLDKRTESEISPKADSQLRKSPRKNSKIDDSPLRKSPRKSCKIDDSPLRKSPRKSCKIENSPLKSSLTPLKKSKKNNFILEISNNSDKTCLSPKKYRAESSHSGSSSNKRRETTETENGCSSTSTTETDTAKKQTRKDKKKTVSLKVQNSSANRSKKSVSKEQFVNSVDGLSDDSELNHYADDDSSVSSSSVCYKKSKKSVKRKHVSRTKHVEESSKLKFNVCSESENESETASSQLSKLGDEIEKSSNLYKITSANSKHRNVNITSTNISEIEKVCKSTLSKSNCLTEDPFDTEENNIQTVVKGKKGRPKKIDSSLVKCKKAESTSINSCNKEVSVKLKSRKIKIKKRSSTFIKSEAEFLEADETDDFIEDETSSNSTSKESSALFVKLNIKKSKHKTGNDSTNSTNDKESTFDKSFFNLELKGKDCSNDKNISFFNGQLEENNASHKCEKSKNYTKEESDNKSVISSISNCTESNNSVENVHINNTNIQDSVSPCYKDISRSPSGVSKMASLEIKEEETKSSQEEVTKSSQEAKSVNKSAESKSNVTSEQIENNVNKKGIENYNAVRERIKKILTMSDKNEEGERRVSCEMEEQSKSPMLESESLENKVEKDITGNEIISTESDCSELTTKKNDCLSLSSVQYGVSKDDDKVITNGRETNSTNASVSFCGKNDRSPQATDAFQLLMSSKVRRSSETDKSVPDNKKSEELANSENTNIKGTRLKVNDNTDQNLIEKDKQKKRKRMIIIDESDDETKYNRKRSSKTAKKSRRHSKIKLKNKNEQITNEANISNCSIVKEVSNLKDAKKESCIETISCEEKCCLVDDNDNENIISNPEKTQSESAANAFQLLMSSRKRQSRELDKIEQGNQELEEGLENCDAEKKLPNSDMIQNDRNKIENCNFRGSQRKRKIIKIEESEDETKVELGNKEIKQKRLRKSRKYAENSKLGSQNEEEDKDTDVIENECQVENPNVYKNKRSSKEIDHQLHKAIKNFEKAEKSLQKYLKMKSDFDSSSTNAKVYAVKGVCENSENSNTDSESSSHGLKVTLKSVKNLPNSHIVNSVKSKMNKNESVNGCDEKPISVTNDIDCNNKMSSENPSVSISEIECNVDEQVENSFVDKNNLEEPKRKSNIFSYFNKVSKDDVQTAFRKEKISTKALVHSPPVSPSKKIRKSKTPLTTKNTVTANLRRSRRILEKSEEISVVQSEVVELHENRSDTEDGEVLVPARRSKVRLNFSDDEFLDQDTKRRTTKKSKVRKSSNTKDKMNSQSAEESSSDSDVVVVKAPVKLAPIFIKKKKYKPDPREVEAKRLFLSSGVPDVVKKMMEMQRMYEESAKLITFPTISHIQQIDSSAYEWNLPVQNIKLLAESSESMNFDMLPGEVLQYGTISSCNIKDKSIIKTKLAPPTPITSFRKILHDIKLQYPEFPVYKVFRKLRAKFQALVNDPKDTEDKPKKIKISEAEEESSKPDNSELSQLPWTEKYKPTSEEEIFNNTGSILQLKCWLESWKKCSLESNVHQAKSAVSSCDEFIRDDSDDEDYSHLPDNAAILIGPPGSGKTAAVYAIANELGCEVLEINTSSKRGGKQVLAEVQEATQSHRVEKGSGLNNSGNIARFLDGKDKKSAKKFRKKIKKAKKEQEKQCDSKSSHKMSLILIEEADVVFEGEDEGFVSALSSLVTLSKRPVILLSSDPNCPHLSKFMDQHLVLKFTPYSPWKISIWMQLVCLLEGVWISTSAIQSLLQWNQGDVRKTLNHLQFWVTSNGNYESSFHEVLESKELVKDSGFNPPGIEDDSSNMSWDVAEEKCGTSIPLLSKCLNSFLLFDETICNYCPYPLTLSILWWNLGPLLNNECSQSRLSRMLKERDVEDTQQQSNFLTDFCSANSDEEDSSKDKKEMTENKNNENRDNENEDIIDKPSTTKSSEPLILSECKDKSETQPKCNQKEMSAFYRLLDTMSYVDTVTSLKSFNKCHSIKKIHSVSWDTAPKLGTSLKDCDNAYLDTEKNFCETLAHYELCKCLELCKQTLESCKQNTKEENLLELAHINMAVPSLEEHRWCEEQHRIENVASVAVGLSSLQDRTATALEYQPTLRTIGRAEKFNKSVGSKRHNRYFSLLRGLGIHTDTSTLNAMCLAFDESR